MKRKRFLSRIQKVTTKHWKYQQYRKKIFFDSHDFFRSHSLTSHISGITSRYALLQFLLKDFFFLLRRKRGGGIGIEQITSNTCESAITVDSYKFLNKTSEITRIQKSHKQWFLQEKWQWEICWTWPSCLPILLSTVEEDHGRLGDSTEAEDAHQKNEN